MAKKQQKAMRKSPRSRKAPRKTRQLLPLDKPALEYANLLVDPCTAPLVHPIYAGGDSGYLFRAESTFSWASDATQTAGVLHWTPNAIGINGIDLVGGGSATSGG